MTQGRRAGAGQAAARVNSREDLGLLVDVATRFYLQGESQVNIARALGINASTISRYLKRARDSGLIQLRVTAPQPLNMDLGRELANHFGLSRVVVANATDGGKALAAAAADLPRVADALSAAGFGDEDVRGMLGGNWLRSFRRVLPV